MSEPLINQQVIEVLQDTLHTTEDAEAQAALWQTLAGVSDMAERLDYLESQMGAVRWIVRPIAGATPE